MLLFSFAPVQDAPQAIAQTVVSSPRAERAPTDTDADVIVVTAGELRDTGERSLPRQIGKATGVWIQETNLGGGSPILQGLSGNQVLIVVDGVRLNDSTTRNGVNQMLNGVDPATVERVEILRGPRSVLYGSDALGGVVLIWTRTRHALGDAGAATAKRTFQAETDLTFQTPTLGFYGSQSLSDAYADWAWLAIGSYHSWDDLLTPEGRIDDTGYDGDAFFGSLETRFDPWRTLRFTATATQDYDVPRTDRLVPGSGQSTPANAEFDYAIQDRQRAVLTYDDVEPWALADRMQARFYYKYYDEQRVIRATGSSTRRMEFDTTNSLGMGIDLSKALGSMHVLTYGIDLDYDDVDSGRTDVDLSTGTSTPKVGSFAPGSNYLSGGAYVQDEIIGLDPFDVTAGLRYGIYDFDFRDPATSQEIERDFGAFSGSLAVGARLGDGMRVVGTVAQGYRAPNLAELARDATFAAGTELPNPDLEPETSLYAELAFQIERDTWNAAFAAYHDDISDVVGRVLVDPGGPQSGDEVYLRENIATLEIWGAYWTAQTQLFDARSPWSLRLVAEYTYGQQYDDFVDPLTGDQPFDDVPGQRIPPFHGLIGLRYDLDAGPWRWTELSCQWAFDQERLSPQDLSDPRIDPDGTDGFAVFDLDVGGPVGGSGSGSTWTLGVHNLFDTSYRVHGSGIDGPAFGLVFGLHLSY